jgi:hypothetical protein
MHLPNFFSAALFLSLLMLPALSMPAGNQSWTEQPWQAGAPLPLEKRVSNISDPVAFNLLDHEPRSVRLGEKQMNYSDYIAATSSAPVSSELWIVKGQVWSRYVQASAGEDVDLIVQTTQDASTDIYLISYANSTINHWNFKLLAGYHRLKLRPEETGRHFLLAAQGSEPAGALILDVLPRQSEPALSSLDVKSILIGEALITVRSQRITGYDVYVDGVFFSSDSSDGALDGFAAFTIGGDKTHTITISQRDGQGGVINKSEHTKNFKRETAYTLLMD